MKVLKAIQPLEAKDLVRAQFRGYQNEPGVAAGSRTETFAAFKLEINSWRWRGVPFYLRAGKCLPVTCTEIIVRLRQPPTMYEGFDLKMNHCRVRISPDVVLAIKMNAIATNNETLNEPVEIAWGHCPRAEEMDASHEYPLHGRPYRRTCGGLGSRSGFPGRRVWPRRTVSAPPREGHRLRNGPACNVTQRLNKL